jgi:hypothetical protein
MHRHPDGSVGFVQMDVSINPEQRDVRVLSFEDRHDCMKCLTVLRQWPEMQRAQLSMGAVPSAVVEQEIRWVGSVLFLPPTCFLSASSSP